MYFTITRYKVVILAHIGRCDLSVCRFLACYWSTWELISLVASVELLAQLVGMGLLQHLFLPLFPVVLLSNVRTDANCVAFCA